LESFPLTPSGKLNRNALPVPRLDAYLTGEYEAPLGEIEEVVARIWRTLLNLDRIGRQDNFFELGGHSLHGMKLVAKVSDEFKVTLSSIAVFQYPTIRQMAQHVDSLRHANVMSFEPGSTEYEHGVI
jgi:acyl carrier protein